MTCRICVNRCRMGPGELGFCGLRENRGGKVHSRPGTSRLGVFTAYHDLLPTNCVADWVCPGCSGSGHPAYSVSRGSENGHKNLAVFLAACSFDCLFCQNWSFRENTEMLAPLSTPGELADMVDDRTSCICFFGGDPSPRFPFALAASKRALALSLETGGCMKFDIKAWDENLNRALPRFPRPRHPVQPARLPPGLLDGRHGQHDREDRAGV